MNAKKMIELLQQHHPHIGETEAYILINQAKDDFCQDTEMVKGLGSFTTTAGSHIKAPRLQGTLNIKDIV